MRKGGLEPPRGNPHYHLKVARIPIPPLSHVLEKKRYYINSGDSAQAKKKFLQISARFSCPCPCACPCPIIITIGHGHAHGRGHENLGHHRLISDEKMDRIFSFKLRNDREFVKLGKRANRCQMF